WGAEPLALLSGDAGAARQVRARLPHQARNDGLQPGEPDDHHRRRLHRRGLAEVTDAPPLVPRTGPGAVSVLRPVSPGRDAADLEELETQPFDPGEHPI